MQKLKAEVVWCKKIICKNKSVNDPRRSIFTEHCLPLLGKFCILMLKSASLVGFKFEPTGHKKSLKISFDNSITPNRPSFADFTAPTTYNKAMNAIHNGAKYFIKLQLIFYSSKVNCHNEVQKFKSSRKKKFNISIVMIFTSGNRVWIW